jgi:hypothetical protein
VVPVAIADEAMVVEGIAELVTAALFALAVDAEVMVLPIIGIAPVILAAPVSALLSAAKTPPGVVAEPAAAAALQPLDVWPEQPTGPGIPPKFAADITLALVSDGSLPSANEVWPPAEDAPCPALNAGIFIALPSGETRPLVPDGVPPFMREDRSARSAEIVPILDVGTGPMPGITVMLVPPPDEEIVFTSGVGTALLPERTIEARPGERAPSPNKELISATSDEDALAPGVGTPLTLDSVAEPLLGWEIAPLPDVVPEELGSTLDEGDGLAPDDNGDDNGDDDAPVPPLGNTFVSPPEKLGALSPEAEAPNALDSVVGSIPPASSGPPLILSGLPAPPKAAIS